MIFVQYFAEATGFITLQANFNQGALMMLLISALAIALLGLIFISDRMLSYGKDVYAKDSDANYSIVPKLKDRLWQAPKTDVVKNSTLKKAPYINLKQGFDIKIEGTPALEIKSYTATTYVVNPKDFMGLSPIPKVLVETGDEVKAGDILFFDKKNPDVQYVSPVSGEIASVNRGEKRSIGKIVILADKEMQYKSFDVPSLSSLTRQNVIEHMLNAGLWPFLKQRPYNEIANHHIQPKGIYISTFDSNPLAPDYSFTLAGQDKYFQAGIDALAKLTDGAIHLGLNAKSNPASLFVNAKNVKHYWFNGKHPYGNVGIQIHHIDPILKGDIVWTVNPEELVTIGKYFTEGKYDPVVTVAVGGPVVTHPAYFRTHIGASISGLIKDNLEKENVRFVSGNVLTGKQISAEGHLTYSANQLTVLEEGDHYELFGWLLPSYMRPSLSNTFPAALFPNYEHDVNTNTHGEHRAFVVTGQYESVLPMDIYPQHLLKSIIANDLDKMEGLGIYEVVEEDLAICEFVCTSKQQVQQILREGIEYLKEQG
jgi:Na+-transporting NADH:ubiquinone oxidoreductase subunit A